MAGFPGLPSAAYVHTLGASNGTDDTATINAALAVISGVGTVKGQAGQTYTISAPLVIKSGTTLDMTGCQVNLINGAQATNMVNNYALSHPNRTVSDGAITSGAGQLTSATAAFTSADVGRTVVIAGAGPGGSVLTANIGTVTNGTTVQLIDLQGLTQDAFTTVSGAAVSIYTRDIEITLIGGVWNPGLNQGGTDNTSRHCLRFRHVDGLTILANGGRLTQTGGKYGINPGDCSRVKIHGWDFATDSSPVQCDGPISIITISGLTGTSGDDFVALGTNGGTAYAQYFDTCGPMYDITVEDINPSATTTTALQIFTGDGLNAPTYGGGFKIDKVRVRDFGGYGGTGGADISISTYNYGDAVNDVEIDGVFATRGASGLKVNLACVNTDMLKIRNVASNGSASVTDQIVQVTSWARLATFVVEGVTQTNSTGSNPLVGVAGTITDLLLSDFHAALNGSGYCVSLNASTGAITRAKQSDGTIIGGGGAWDTDSHPGATLGRAHLSHVDVSASAWAFGAFDTTTILHVDGCSAASGVSGLFYLDASASLTVLGGDGMDGGGFGITTVAGYALRVNGPNFPLDISKITVKDEGDMAFNTNAALSCGAGPVGYHSGGTGNGWKQLVTGATY